MRKLLIFLLLTAVGTVTAADKFESINRAHTYSIVCYDSATGQFGAAVQSHWFKVANVIWAEAGVGAVATQSLSDYSYGPLGLQLLKNGRTPGQALAGLTEADPNSEVRQVAIINQHEASTHTGEKCIAQAGHVTGVNYSVQANLMEKNTVWQAMADAFETAKGDLADRMMAALEAAQAEGGDIRGKQSAAMIVVAAEPTGQIWRDKLVDIRVDDSPEPLKELRRLLDITRAYDHMDKGDEAITVENFELAQTEYEAAARLAPGNVEIMFWYAATLVTVDRIEAALPIFKDVFAKDENWRVLIPRLVEADLLPDDPEVIERIVGL